MVDPVRLSTRHILTNQSQDRDTCPAWQFSLAYGFTLSRILATFATGPPTTGQECSTPILTLNLVFLYSL